MKINEVAKLAGVTVRTLHYYDQIGLLHPSKTTETGYRIYDEDALETLQQILFFKELEFPLNDIKEIMTSQCYDKQETLIRHRELLMQKKKRLDILLETLEAAINGEHYVDLHVFDMSQINEMKETYAAELKDRWGETEEYCENERKTSGYNDVQWNILMGEGAEILRLFGKNRHLKPDSDEAQKLVERWKAYITVNFHNCTNTILSCLSLMYIEDKRFKENIDRNGKGTAEFKQK
ncbi:MAG TPA: MerR family transcriptional regulator [Lachnospiraceae bacterium]|nr:MerR family transcriptional regulator [Lachnospiraceae bacterium]